EAVGSIIIVLDPAGRIMLANRRANEVLGYADGELEGQHWFTTAVPADQRAVVQDGFDRAMAKQIKLADTYEHQVLTRDGQRRLIAWNNRTLKDAAGNISALVGAGEDITERRAADDEIRLFARVFEGSAEGVLICNREGLIERTNRAFTDITGYSAAEALGQNPRLLASGRQTKEYFRQMWRDLELAGRWQGEIWNRRKNGEIYPEWLSISTIADSEGELLKYVGIFTDISQSKADQAQIHLLAYYDPLTNLPNRRLLSDRFDQSLAAARRNSRHLAVLFVDIDRFKQINDSLGHPIGDRVLEGVAERFKSCVRESDSLARIGGDEFVLMLPDVESPEDAAVVALKCFEVLKAPFRIDGHELLVTPSIGIALCPQDGETLDALIKAAETAMYAAKEAGRATYRFFTGDMNARIFARMLLENQLRKATQQREFVLHYQPQLDVESGAVIGVEALIRWNHPDQGLVYPGYFITVAEETGLITAIGRWVLGEACQQMASWHAAGLPKISVAVNVAAPQFHTPEFYTHVTDALAQSGLDPRYLELELTESILVQDVEATLQMLRRFKALGVMLSVDDFGTGYSSLSYLKRFPVDRLKIDQSFVRGLSEDQNDRAIVGSVIAMGKNLRLRVLAEGVETAEHLAILKAEGCHEYQGYLYSKPVPAAALAALLASRV
ncbi:MAG TPA: EAL domain-containing protein, partial [Rhodocyclaceae bacterium]|nr:EAL domain-containing protein [Rhodocyclaceae bacterium]